jgi:hypothetical protein
LLSESVRECVEGARGRGSEGVTGMREEQDTQY